LDALVDWKAALCTFGAEAREALSSVEMEIQRTLAWLEDELKYWQSMVRQCEDEVFQAKNELTRKRMMRIGDRPPDTTEQEKDLKRAQARLEHAEEQVEQVRHWRQHLPDAIIEYQGPARQLAGMLEADLPKADALLESKITALEAYLQVSSGGTAEAPSVARAPEAPLPPAPAEKQQSDGPSPQGGAT
jgi:hypothetical protein